MDNNYVIKKVDTSRWEKAQKFEFEFASKNLNTNDDWNFWWAEKFDNYKLIRNRHFANIIEVGCGPFTNMRYILPVISYERVYFEDPLIQFYLSEYIVRNNRLKDVLKRILLKKETYKNHLLRIFSEFKNKVEICSSKLEELPYKDNLFDLLVCINVLDHVNDFEKCMQEINRVLKKGGILIMGQDLSNEEDYINAPESYKDIGHPIKIDEQVLGESINDKYDFLFKKLLSRAEGRNPKAHYGTYLTVASKTI